MFEHTSRYYELPTKTFTTADERKIAYVSRRFLPSGNSLSLLGEVTVTEGDRLDLLAANALGDSEHFWQICDANNATNPVALTAELGRRLRIPEPQV